MTSADFTDAQGNVTIGGQNVPELRVVGFVHRHPCPKHVVATVQIGEPWLCDGCDGTVLMGWRSWWPFPDEKPQGLVVDMGLPEEAD